ncbi:MAG: T9SS type A sorting domain-containing protein [Chitinophagales bacterium]|nr:T9SS type A sorting domain-containing protein [Chitinophagales bacterium]
MDVAKGINNQSIDLSGKSAGTYFVTLSDNGFKQTLKLIVY